MESTRLPETFLAAQTPTVCLTLCDEEIRCQYDLILTRLCQVTALTNVVLRTKQRNLKPLPCQHTLKFMEGGEQNMGGGEQNMGGRVQ